MTIHAALKQYFGYDDFREGQEGLIRDLLEGKDVLGIMPTGAGKSLCFQLPALMMPGLTLIVSPLISLMKDQVNTLIQAGVAAAYINSSLTEGQIEKALQNARNNKYKLIYVAPERLLSGSFLHFARSANISMVTIDEAHCISQWGHDFRPSYARIPEFIANLHPRPVVSAFTATATPKVREDIVESLRLQTPTVLITGFDRPNLYFEIQKPKDKFAALLNFLADKKEQGGIIYCSTRAAVEDVCEKLQNSGYSASRYHAGLPDPERKENQEDFIYDRVQIMVATNAFGMGIDKSNISYVVHYNMPKDMESYYQEAGRAGRDGEPADCILLYSGQDVRTNLWLIENAREAAEPVDELLREQILAHERAKLRHMTFYCSTNDCLRGYILKYFGERPPLHCGNCGSCATNYHTVDVAPLTRKIIACVTRMRGRFGMKMVMDTLRGSKSERIRSLGLDRLSVYGTCSESERELRAVMEHLILSGYLVKTDEKYPVIKLGRRASAITEGDEPILMKLPKDSASDNSRDNTRDSARDGDSDSDKRAKRRGESKSVDRRLFSLLQEVRKTIADEQNLPAFVIFHDSTLTDMCMKIPTTRAALLEVFGVGEVKATRYGERFLKVITSYLRDQERGADEPSAGQSSDQAPAQLADPPPSPAAAFDPATIEISDEPALVSAIADRINCALIESNYNKISARRINDWLLSQEYLAVVTEKGKNVKLPTPKGETLGVIVEERFIRGVKVKINLFGRQAQEYIVSNALLILGTKGR